MYTCVAQVQGAVSYLPGCAEDYEVSRMISEGCLVKRLVSGRLEACEGL